MLLISLILASAAPSAAADAHTLLHTAMTAQGGEVRLRAIRTVQWHATGYRNELEQSERPEGPYIVEADEVDEIHDQRGGRLRTRTDGAVQPIYKFSTGLLATPDGVMRMAGVKKRAGDPTLLGPARETLKLAPECLLLTAYEAPDLRLAPSTVLQSVPQDVVTFTLDGAPVTLYLNHYTHLPTAIDYTGPLARSGYGRFLGDVTMRTLYSMWWIAKGGVHLPLQTNIERNGLPDSQLVIRDLQLDSDVPEADLTIPPDILAAYRIAMPASLDDLPFGTSPAIDLAPGVTIVPGAWNVTYVRQPDGIVVLEAPISSGYSVKALAEAAKRWPGIPVKAVVTSSDSWPHIAGIREYAARGIPIYCLDLNVPIIRRTVTAPYTSRPDLQQRQPREPLLRSVTGKTVIGEGATRIELYPIRGETSERQMMAWFPQYDLLYGSDPFQQRADGSFFYPQTVSELRDAAAREHLRPQRFWMMHVNPSDWKVLEKSVVDAASSDTPDGSIAG